MRAENVTYFSPMSKSEVLSKLANGQLVELSSSYYVATARKLFKEKGFDLYLDRASSKQRGYRLYRVIEISDELPPVKAFTFDPAELVT